MLYGNLIFIKKTGGDGSKYPVTEKNIKIGRSENCVIRIYNPQVAPEHCQLIIDYNGQAKLRNLFTPTILNGKPLGQGDVTLCHGDVFKLGERLARWEYLPTSKYFKQLLSPTGRLVAVVNPQRRSVETAGTSEKQISMSKGTPLGKKRTFSEKFITENSVPKQRRTIGSDGSLKSKIDFGKLLIGHQSIKNGKLILKTPLIKQRKSVGCVISSKTPKSKSEKPRKSLPAYKINVEARPRQSTKNKMSSPKGAVKIPSKRSLKNEVRTPSKSTPIKVKTPKRLKLDSKSGDKTALKTILESPPKVESVRSTRSFSKSPPVKGLTTPKRKSPVQVVSSVQSEKKQKFNTGTPKPNEGVKKMSLTLKRVKLFSGDRRRSLSENTREGKSTKERISAIDDGETMVEVSSSQIPNLTDGRKSSTKDPSKTDDASYGSPKQTRRKSVKCTPVKTLRKSNKLSHERSVKKATDVVQTPPLINFSDEEDSVSAKRTSTRDSVLSSQKSLQKSVKKSSACPLDVFQRSQKVSKKVQTPSVEKTGEEQLQSAVVSPVSTPSRSRKYGNVTSWKKIVSSSNEKAVSSIGVRRKLSPSISSAERAAKKLKTSSPKKPDKNKRAALLVLGKANRRQLLSQNVKVLLKQKILKKAIKQSVVLPVAKDENKASVKKNKKILQKKKKKSTKTNKTIKVSAPARISQTAKESQASVKSTETSVNEPEDSSTIVKKSRERNSLNRSKISSPLPSAKAAAPITGSAKSAVKSSTKAESILSPKSTNQTILPYTKLDKSSESYIFNSSRRCSKRLSSKNDTERPDFVELSPTALGLIPKNIELFKTPKEKKRKSSSLTTPRNIRALGIIKSASTSKIGNRKSVSFLSKDLSVSTTPYTPNIGEKTDFDCNLFDISNITLDVFVSPLDKSSATPIVEFVTDENVKPTEKRRSSPGSKRVARKLLQTPQKEPENKSSKFSDQTETLGSGASDSGVRMPLANPRGRNSPRNDLTDVRGVRRLLATPRQVKSPKNDLTDVRGVKKLFGSPKVQKSPKNDLSDVKGVKKLMQTPKVRKSPKNDLSDVRGVKKLMRTPRAQKSPKNDLTDLRGVKLLMQTPRIQKSPKNDLSDLRGVKKLMRTPKEQKSPKNELSDLRGLKRLLQSPRNQKSPKNDLTDVTGVKRLLKTPKAQKSPKNNLSDVEGVEELFASPQQQKSPTSTSGLKRKVAKTSKEPKNDISDVTGVVELFSMFETEEAERGIESEAKKSPDASEKKIGRGRPRKIGGEKVQKVATLRTRFRKGSAEVKTRVTRSRKQDTTANVEEVRKQAGSGDGKTVRVKKADTVKKVTRTRRETESPKAEEPKSTRKRKPVESIEASPPKSRRTAAGSRQSASKVGSVETKGVGARSRTRKTEEKGEAKSSKKGVKTPAKKAARVQRSVTKSGEKSVSKTQKVQRGRSQVKQESGDNVSPRKTRSVNAKNSSKQTRAVAAGRKK